MKKGIKKKKARPERLREAARFSKAESFSDPDGRSSTWAYGEY
jgi:hypothetical protein